MADSVSFLSENQGWIWSSVLVLIIASVILLRDSFFFTDFFYRLPVVGKLARYSKDLTETTPGSWLHSEANLCQDYARHVMCLSKEEFYSRTEYLRKCYDHGRKPMPGFVRAGLCVLIVLEALGFSFLLGSWLAMESSVNQQQLLNFAIVIVIAVVMMWVTHLAGHQLFRTGLLHRCFKQFQAERIGTVYDLKKPNYFPNQIISLNIDQSIDDGFGQHIQCANRVAAGPNDQGHYHLVVLAAVLIAVVAILATVIRVNTMQANELDNVGNIFGAITGAAKQGSDGSSAQHFAAFASFGMLAVIFATTQAISIAAGFRYGFGGKQSADAYSQTHGSSNFTTYYAPFAKRIQIAGQRLKTLHMLMERQQGQEIDFNREFITYLREMQQIGATGIEVPPAKPEKSVDGPSLSVVEVSGSEVSGRST